MNYSKMSVGELEKRINEKIHNIEQANDDKNQRMKLEPIEEFDDGLELFDDNYVPCDDSMDDGLELLDDDYYQRVEMDKDSSELILGETKEQERARKLRELREYREYCEKIKNDHSQGMHM